MKKTLICPEGTVEYELERKRVKNINLRVRKDGSVHVSASPLTPAFTIESFIRSKAGFILRAQAGAEKRAAAEQNGSRYLDGDMINIFGQAYPLSVLEGKRTAASFDGERVILTAKADADDAQLERAADRLLRELCIVRLTALCDKWLPAFESSIPGPLELRFRSMTSRWGSCQPRRAVVTLNTALIRYPAEAAEYVVVHELTHFLHADHSAAFYASLAGVMPDWKERKRLLR